MNAGRTALMGLSLAAIVACALALFVGSVRLAPSEIWQALWGHSDALTQAIVWRLRLPRVLDAFSCGALLAVAGALLQVLLRNPLADPYVLGVAGGAALGALGALTFGAAALGISAGAFAGSLAALGLVLMLAYQQGGLQRERLLLVGVVLAAGFSACVALILTLAPTAQLRGMLFWLMGDLGNAPGAWPVWLAALLLCIAASSMARSLNILGLGELKAQSMGLNVARTQLATYLLAAGATAVAVSAAGTIGFIGLLTPHLLRLANMADHRVLIPGAAILGGGLLVISDLIGRTAISSTQIPVGVITALLGVPLLLWLLLRSRATH